MAARETENNAYAKFWGEKQRTLWYVMVCYGIFWSGQFQPRSQGPFSLPLKHGNERRIHKNQPFGNRGQLETVPERPISTNQD